MSQAAGSDLRARLAAALGDGYVLGNLLGRGGFAEVWKAHDRTLDRDVAVKVLRPELAEDDQVAERFLREARAMARMSHPHLVAVYGTGAAEGLAFVIMQFVTGESLRSRLEREGALEPGAVRVILDQAAEALEVAHRAGIIHRDVKPDNILLESDGKVLLTDFGIARAREQSTTSLTGTGLILGTPHYMSPEQGGGEATIDARADIYSLGVVGFQLLAGRPPFDATNVLHLLMKHATEQPPALTSVRPDTPTDLSAAIERCLRKRPEDRWATAAEFRAALRRVSSAAMAAPDVAGTLPDSTPSRGVPWWVAAAGIALIVGIALDVVLATRGVTTFAGVLLAAAIGAHGWGVQRHQRAAQMIGVGPNDPTASMGATGPYREAQALRADRAALVAMLGRVPAAERRLLDDARRAMDDLVTRADEATSRLSTPTPRSLLVDADDSGARRRRDMEEVGRCRAVGVELRKAVRRVWSDGMARASEDVARALHSYEEMVRREA